MTPDLLARLRGHKVELLRLLASLDGDAGPVTAGPLVTDQPAGNSPSELQPHGADGSHDDDGNADEWQEYIDADGRRRLVRSDVADCEVVDLQPCPVCGGLQHWQDLLDQWHCEHCEPRTAGPRQRYAVPDADVQPAALPGWILPSWPSVVPAEIVAAPIPTCNDCGRRTVIPGQPGRRAGLCFECWSKQN